MKPLLPACEKRKFSQAGGTKIKPPRDIYRKMLAVFCTLQCSELQQEGIRFQDLYAVVV